MNDSTLIYMSVDFAKKLIADRFDFAPDDALRIVELQDKSFVFVIQAAIGRFEVIKPNVFISLLLNPFGYPSMNKYWEEGEWSDFVSQLEKRAMISRITSTDGLTFHPTPVEVYRACQNDADGLYSFSQDGSADKFLFGTLTEAEQYLTLLNCEPTGERWTMQKKETAII